MLRDAEKRGLLTSYPRRHQSCFERGLGHGFSISCVISVGIYTADVDLGGCSLNDRSEVMNHVGLIELSRLCH